VLCVLQVHVIIQEIFLNGAVHKDGRIFPGDQVVAVSESSVTRLYLQSFHSLSVYTFTEIFLFVTVNLLHKNVFGEFDPLNRYAVNKLRFFCKLLTDNRVVPGHCLKIEKRHR